MSERRLVRDRTLAARTSANPPGNTSPSTPPSGGHEKGPAAHVAAEPSSNLL
jgi:hypothetical protein